MTAEGLQISLRRLLEKGARGRLPRAFLLGVAIWVTVLAGGLASPAQGQILNRLRRTAEEALGETEVIQRLLEEPPGITTSIHDAHTEVPFLDGYDPRGSADLGGLPMDARNAFFAPPGLYEMEAWSYCIQAGTYGPTGGDGYALAPLKGELAPILQDLVRRSVDHPEVAQTDIQSLIWALQSRIPINEMSPELQLVAETLLDSRQIEALSEGFVDMAKEELLIQARDQMPDAVRRVAEAEARLRELLREGAAFEELEAAAVLTGSPPPDELVREVPTLRWNYHPEGYFIRFSPRDYTLTYVQAYVPEEYLLGRDGEGRVTEIMGPHGTRLVLEYGESPGGAGGRVGILNRVGLVRGGSPVEAWGLSGWTFVGNQLAREVVGGAVPGGELEARRDSARELRRQTREVIASALGSESRRPGEDLADLSHLWTALMESDGGVPQEVLTHLTRAWQYALCVEAGGCGSPRVGWRGIPDDGLARPGDRGPAAAPEGGFRGTTAFLPYRRAGGGASIDAGGNVAAPGNTGAQRLLQSGKPTLDKANAAMKVMGLFLALADVIGSVGSLGQMAYNALGMAGLPVGHLGLPTMMAGAMISQVTDAWSTATDALAGDTGSEGSGDTGGGEGSSEGGGDFGGSGSTDPGGVGDPFGSEADPSESGIMGEGADGTETRSDGEDYENTPPPNPPPPPNPAPSGGGGGASGERTNAAYAFSESLITTLYHTQAFVDSNMRQEAACRAGSSEWAGRQAGLAGEHRRQAALGMLDTASKLDNLLAVAQAEGVLEGDWAYAEDLEVVQGRLRSQGWSGEEMRMAALLGITDSEMAILRQRLLGQDTEGVSGDMDEAVRLWAKELRTAGYLWLALPQPGGDCNQ